MNADLVIFDLDGTLIDSRRDLATSVNEMLASYGSAPLPDDRVIGYVGSGARVLVERALAAAGRLLSNRPPTGGRPASPGARRTLGEGVMSAGVPVEEALARFEEVYLVHACDTTRPYPGMVETLEALAASRALAVLTNKPAAHTRAILDCLDLTRWFGEIVAADGHPVPRKPDPAGVRQLLERTDTPARCALLVGDSLVDIETGRNAGVPTCGVTYGFGAPEEILAARPDLVIAHPRELLTHLE